MEEGHLRQPRLLGLEAVLIMLTQGSASRVDKCGMSQRPLPDDGIDVPALRFALLIVAFVGVARCGRWLLTRIVFIVQ
jgi:hypothetical protein